MAVCSVGQPQDDLLTQIPDIPLMAPQFFALKFPGGSPGSQTVVDSAKLRLYSLGSETETLPSLRVTVFQLRLQRTVRPSSPRSVVMVDSKVVDVDARGAVRRWQQSDR